jgi:hypothetical protein
VFWMTLKSALRQWYIGLGAIAIISLLELLLNIQIPVEVKGAFWLTAAQSVLKMAEKAIRAWVSGWSAEQTEIR